MSFSATILTLFPEMVRTVLGTSILGRAAQQGLVVYEVTDIRDFAVDKHRTVDDTAYGGGAGMIMMAPPVVEAVEKVRRREDATVSSSASKRTTSRFRPSSGCGAALSSRRERSFHTAISRANPRMGMVAT